MAEPLTPTRYEGMSVDERAAHYGVRPFAPLKADHPLAENPVPCAVCNRELVVGDVLCLLVLDSEENREAAEEAKGGAYNAVASPSHWICVTGSDDPEGDWERWYGE